jgi:hypothetical protein
MMERAACADAGVRRRVYLCVDLDRLSYYKECYAWVAE